MIGIIVIDDKIRNDANNAIKSLKRQGLGIRIMSGDRREAVQEIGRQLGFANNLLDWQLLPEDKLNNLENLKSDANIAMVGDGINDAPALAISHLGVAIGTGTQIAQDSADLVLLGDSLESFPKAFLLAQKTIKKIKQNLFWAFGYNIISLPIAAGILLPNFGILLSPPKFDLLNDAFINSFPNSSSNSFKKSKVGLYSSLFDIDFNLLVSTISNILSVFLIIL